MERAVFNHYQPDDPEGVLGLAEPPALSPSEFEHIRRLAQQNFGLHLKDGKQGLVVARLGKELRRHGFTSYQQYCHHVEADPNGTAMMELANALTTNFTSFLREPAHFDFLKSTFVDELLDRNAVEIWTAACSTGEEPYSILFTLLEAMGATADIRILATDLSTRALRAAAAAVYDSARVEALTPGWPQKYFLRGNGKWQGFYRVKPEYRERVQFQRFNLISSQLPSRKFPAVFCRNVAIYFDKPTQAAVVKRLASTLIPGGYIFIGHSESLAGVDHNLEYVRPALYRTGGKGVEWHRK
jgi:chemotaxis protein methyltransferase CheR